MSIKIELTKLEIILIISSGLAIILLVGLLSGLAVRPNYCIKSDAIKQTTTKPSFTTNCM